MMASAEQIKALLQSHADGDDDRFYSVAMQVAAHEARLGHGKLAKELRDLIDAAKTSLGKVPTWSAGVMRGEISSAQHWSYPKVKLGDLILSDHLMEQIRRVVREHRQAGHILEHGLSPRRKLLFIGPKGAGKGFSASVLAGELGLPLLQVPFDALYARYRHETQAKLQDLFHAATSTRGVYFFAEVDIWWSGQVTANATGEGDQVLNSFLAMIEQDHSRSILVVSMSHPDPLDIGLVRCFDDVMEYALPSESQIARLLEARLRHVAVEGTDWRKLAGMATGLSYSEVSAAANDALKSAIIAGLSELGDSDINAMLVERKAISHRIDAHTNPSR